MKRFVLTCLVTVGLALPDVHAQIRDSLFWVVGPWMSAAPIKTAPAFNIGMPPAAFITFGKDGTFVMSLSVEGEGKDGMQPKDASEWLARMGLAKLESVMTHPFFMAGFYTVTGDGAEQRFTLNVQDVSTAPDYASFKAQLGPIRFGVERGRVDPARFTVQGLLTDDGTLVLFSGRQRLAFRRVE